MEFTVSMNPGDNFRVVAACNANYFTGLSAKQNDGVKATVVDGGGNAVSANQITELLTVWRRLHVEIDTMKKAPDGEPFGKIVGKSGSISASSLISQGNPAWPADTLEGGVLNPNGNDAAITVDYVHKTSWQVSGNNANTVTVITDYTDDGFDNDGDKQADKDEHEKYEMTPAENTDFCINTDDPEWLTPACTHPAAAAAIAGMNNYFKDAYIECVEADGNTNPDFNFKRHSIKVAANGTLDLCFDNTVDVARNADYWAVAIAWCYDGVAREPKAPCIKHLGVRSWIMGDGDPEGEGVPGNSSCYTGYTKGDRTTSSIYCETKRDVGGSVMLVATHEVGHQFGLMHVKNDGTFQEDAIKDDRGIMGFVNDGTMCSHDWSDTEPASHELDRFSNNNIRDLRKEANPW